MKRLLLIMFIVITNFASQISAKSSFSYDSNDSNIKEYYHFVDSIKIAFINFQDSIIKSDYHRKDAYGRESISQLRGLSIRAVTAWIQKCVTDTFKITALNAEEPRFWIAINPDERSSEKVKKNRKEQQDFLDRYQFTYYKYDTDKLINNLLDQGKIVITYINKLDGRYKQNINLNIYKPLTIDNKNIPEEILFEYQIGLYDYDSDKISFLNDGFFDDYGDFYSIYSESDLKWFLYNIECEF